MNAAIIGLGPQGRRVAAAIDSLPWLSLTDVVDSRPEALAWDQLPTGVRRHTTAEALWAQGAPELVCVVTNSPSHTKLAAAAIHAGARRLMVEKPLACSLAECDELIGMARTHAVRVAADQTTRHAPLYRWVRDKIASGAWGEPRALWLQRPGIGLGCNGIHSFDIARFLTGREATRVTAWIDEPLRANPRGAEFIDPGGTVVIELGPGVRAVVAQVEDGAGPSSISVHLTGARVRIDERSGSIEVIERDLSVIPGPGRPAVFRTATVPPEVAQYPDIPPAVADLLTELAGDGPLESDATHGRAAVEILAAAYLSSGRGNTPVTLPLTAPDELALWMPVT